MTWKQTQLHLEEGDVITSEKGILQKSPLTDKYYLLKKAKYLGDGHWCAIIKEDINVKPINKQEAQK